MAILDLDVGLHGEATYTGHLTDLQNCRFDGSYTSYCFQPEQETRGCDKADAGHNKLCGQAGSWCFSTLAVRTCMHTAHKHRHNTPRSRTVAARSGHRRAA